jgi:hypothetical protein
MFIKYSYLILNNNNAFLIYFLKQLHRDDMNTKKKGGGGVLAKGILIMKRCSAFTIYSSIIILFCLLNIFIFVIVCGSFI